MIIDSLGLFSDDQAVTASAASTNVVNLGSTGTPAYSSVALVRDLGKSDIPLLVKVTTDFATLTSLAVTVQGSTDEAFTSPVTLASSGAIALASLVAGYEFPIEFLPNGTTYQYLRMYYTVAGSDATAGKVYAAINAGIPNNYRGG